MKFLIENRNNLLNDLMARVNLTTNLLEAKSYLTWNGSLQVQRRNIQLAKDLNIKSYIYNHGVYGHNDHNPEWTDIHTKMGGASMTADKYLCWGQHEYDDFIKWGYKPEQLEVVGCTTIWSNIYTYRHNEKEIKVNYFAGSVNIDPKTQNKWELIDEQHFIPKRKEITPGIVYVPHHDTLDRHLEMTKATYEKIKDLPGLLIKASSSYSGDRNIFKDLPNVMYGNILLAENIEWLRRILVESKLVITDIPGTINVLCYAYGIPIITINHDHGLKINGKSVQHDCPADIMCDLDDILPTVDKVLSGEIDRTKEMSEWSEILCGISKGWPVNNILKVISE